MDSRTKQKVIEFSLNQSFFFERFAFSMVKMGQLSVLTGQNGEIRSNCSAKNGGRISMWLTDEEGESVAY